LAVTRWTDHRDTSGAERCGSAGGDGEAARARNRGDERIEVADGLARRACLDAQCGVRGSRLLVEAQDPRGEGRQNTRR
jgi:hypothetical protein